MPMHQGSPRDAGPVGLQTPIINKPTSDPGELATRKDKIKKMFSSPEAQQTLIILGLSLMANASQGKSTPESFARAGLGALQARSKAQAADEQRRLEEEKVAQQGEFREGQLEVQKEGLDVRREGQASSERIAAENRAAAEARANAATKQRLELFKEGQKNADARLDKELKAREALAGLKVEDDIYDDAFKATLEAEEAHNERVALSDEEGATPFNFPAALRSNYIRRKGGLTYDEWKQMAGTKITGIDENTLYASYAADHQKLGLPTKTAAPEGFVPPAPEEPPPATEGAKGPEGPRGPQRKFEDVINDPAQAKFRATVDTKAREILESGTDEQVLNFWRVTEDVIRLISPMELTPAFQNRVALALRNLSAKRAAQQAAVEDDKIPGVLMP